jgi:hypothetical protein
MNMTSNILETGIKLVKNVGSFNFGTGCLEELSNKVFKQRETAATNQFSGVTIILKIFQIQRTKLKEQKCITAKMIKENDSEIHH